MKKYGEIITLDNSTATVRIYKVKRGEYIPTASTVNALLKTEVSVGDAVKLHMNGFLYFFSALFGYGFPFLTSVIVYIITSTLTQNIVAIQSAFLLTLFVTYLVAKFISNNPYFKKITICTVTEVITEE